MDLEALLTKCIDPVSELVAKTVETLFQKPVQLVDDWKFVSSFSNPCDLVCIMGASNAKFSAFFATGLDFAAAQATLGENESEAFYRDALGELANSICGELIKVPLIVGELGIFVQSPPILIKTGSSLSFPKAQGITGTVRVGGHELWAGFSLRSI